MCSENFLERLFGKPITSSQAFGKPNEKCFCAFFCLIPVIISLVIVFLVIFRDLAEQFGFSAFLWFGKGGHFEREGFCNNNNKHHNKKHNNKKY